MFRLTREDLPFFLPLGFVGVYRWFWFFVRVLAYCLYKPLKPRRHPRFKPYRDVTILIPTIDSGEEIKIAMKSWLKNNPYEIIFITIPKAKPAIEELVANVDPERRVARVITVNKPNKRNQMVAGVNHVRTEITVFCDDDAVWPDTMLVWCLAPFEDRQMGGVGTSQTVLPVGKHMTIWEILAAYRISMRNIEITSTTYIDGGVCCLSGRTAVYRTAIMRDPKFQWDFTHEFWLGRYHQHSGDDKFLTRWLHSHQWKTYIQACPEVELLSTFKNNWRFLKQLLRWTRNTWRSDIRSLIYERHIWMRYPFVAFTMLDKFFNPLTLLAGPVTVVYYICKPNSPMPAWVVVTSYITWLIVTRTIKYMPHFVRRPQDMLVIPVWLVFSIYFVLLKIYCLFTLHVTDWGTREGADHKEENTDISEIFIPHWQDDDEGGGGDDEGGDGKGGARRRRDVDGHAGVAGQGGQEMQQLMGNGGVMVGSQGSDDTVLSIKEPMSQQPQQQQQQPQQPQQQQTYPPAMPAVAAAVQYQQLQAQQYQLQQIQMQQYQLQQQQLQLQLRQMQQRAGGGGGGTTAAVAAAYQRVDTVGMGSPAGASGGVMTPMQSAGDAAMSGFEDAPYAAVPGTPLGDEVDVGGDGRNGKEVVGPQPSVLLRGGSRGGGGDGAQG